MDSSLPQLVSTILPKLCPLVLDGSNGVRTQLLKLLRSLPHDVVEDHVSEILPYIRAGMTHLAAEVRLSAVDDLSWLLQVAGSGVVTCAGGWVKTMNCFLTALGWHAQNSVGWSATRASGRAGSEGKPMVRNLQVLAEFLGKGLDIPLKSAVLSSVTSKDSFPLWHVEQHGISQKSNAFGYLNLFGLPRDDETAMLEDREDRVRILVTNFKTSIERGLEGARREGGEGGRAAAAVMNVLKTSLED